MKIQIALFKSSGPIASLIKWQTDSKYSHAALLFDDEELGMKLLAESVAGKGVIARNFEKDEDVDLYNVFLSEEEGEAVAHYVASQIGKGYDYWGVLRFISRRRLPENDKWFCSELVFEAFKQAGINLLARVESWQVSPGLLSYSPGLSKV